MSQQASTQVQAMTSLSTACGESSGANKNGLDSSLDIGRAPRKDPALLQGDALIAAGKLEAGKVVANEVDGTTGPPVAMRPGYEIVAESGDTLVLAAATILARRFDRWPRSNPVFMSCTGANGTGWQRSKRRRHALSPQGGILRRPKSATS